MNPSVTKAINYIESHLKDNIPLTKVYKKVGYSSFHFSRLFAATTGLTLKDYILRRKLSEAAKELVGSQRKIIDVAFDYNFQNHETFSRAFRRVFGINPLTYRKKQDLRLHLLAKLTEENFVKLPKISIPEPELIELDELHLVGLLTLVENSNSIINRLWSEFMRTVKSIEYRQIPEKYYQLSFWPPTIKTDSFFVMCAVAAAKPYSPHVHFVDKVIPKSLYLKFVHRGRSRNVVATYKYIFETWLPKSSYITTKPYELEFYGKKYKGPNNPNSESEIYIPVERQISKGKVADF